MKEKLETGFLHTITLNEKDIVWVKKNKEIRIGNSLFDIKSIIKVKNKILVTGLYDHEESEIEQVIGELSGNNRSTQFTLNGLFSVLQNIFYNSTYFEIPAAINIPPGKSIFYISSLMKMPRRVLTPPPQR